MSAPPDTFHVMAKPSGAICNLDCRYCFYLDKESLFDRGAGFRMSDEVLTACVQQQIAAQRGPEVLFAWQGGEPTLMGVDFFERAVSFQRRHAAGRTIQNAFQTNGILLDDAWGEFLKRENFLVGLSLDGPQPLHDLYRVDKSGQPTFERVMRGLAVLKKHGVEFNTLTVVHRDNARQPLEVYRFLKEIGSGFLQFIPLVERRPAAETLARGLDHAPPPTPDTTETEVTDWTVRAADYGEFLVTLFDEWVRADVGKVFVQLFDVALGNWLGQPAGLCLFRETCGDAVARSTTAMSSPATTLFIPATNSATCSIAASANSCAARSSAPSARPRSERSPRFAGIATSVSCATANVRRTASSARRMASRV